MIFQSRLLGYVINASMSGGVYFCAIAAWGDPRPPQDAKLASVGGIGDLVGIGQWRIEKQKFQAVCVQAYKALPPPGQTPRDELETQAGVSAPAPPPGKVIDATPTPAAGPFSMHRFDRDLQAEGGVPIGESKTKHKSFMCC